MRYYYIKVLITMRIVNSLAHSRIPDFLAPCMQLARENLFHFFPSPCITNNNKPARLSIMNHMKKERRKRKKKKWSPHGPFSANWREKLPEIAQAACIPGSSSHPRLSALSQYTLYTTEEVVALLTSWCSCSTGSRARFSHLPVLLIFLGGW